METKPRRLESYIAPNDTVPFDEWLGGLRDRVAKAAIDQRLNRLQRGLAGEFEKIGEGLIELKIDLGPGDRVYCADDGESVLLLCGGSKRTQTADIARAKHYRKGIQELKCRKGADPTRQVSTNVFAIQNTQSVI